MFHASYLSALTPENFTGTVNGMVALLKQHYPTANMLIGRGLSGTMLIPALAAALKCQWGIMRKRDESHSCYQLEVSYWPDEGARAVFVDDLIDSGATVRAVCEKFASQADSNGRDYAFLGAALYDGGYQTVLAFGGQRYPVICLQP